MNDEPVLLDASAVLARIRQRHGKEYAVITEVRDATGFNGKRSADALCMCLWPSRGLELHGFEIKVSRTDWLKELSQPEKSEAIAKYCDRWWIAVGDASIVKLPEVPKAWGLLVPHKDGLKVAKPAELIEAVPMTRSFLAAVFRRCVEQSEDTRAIEEARADERKKAETDARRHVGYEYQVLVNMRDKLREFEQASGVRIENGWESGEKIGAAVKAVLANEHVQHLHVMQQVAYAKERLAEIIEPFVEEMKRHGIDPNPKPLGRVGRRKKVS